jgi:hypothetical protein
MIAINLKNFCKGNRTSGKTGGRGRPVLWEELICNSGASFLQEVGWHNGAATKQWILQGLHSETVHHIPVYYSTEHVV